MGKLGERERQAWRRKGWQEEAEMAPILQKECLKRETSHETPGAKMQVCKVLWGDKSLMQDLRLTVVT